MFRADFRRLEEGERPVVTDRSLLQVYGYQCEVETSERQWTGGIYGEAMGGWKYPLSKVEEHAKARVTVQDHKSWNRITIYAKGDLLKTWVNGVPCANLTNQERNNGFFCLQVHQGQKGQIEKYSCESFNPIVKEYWHSGSQKQRSRRPSKADRISLPERTNHIRVGGGLSMHSLWTISPFQLEGHSGQGLKQLNEWIEKGYLGEVSEVHAWTLAGWNDANVTRPGAQPVPSSLDWDLWLNAAAEVPHHKAYYPAAWRGWNEFGSGALGDWACHNMDAPYFALGLDCPEKVEIESTGPSLLSFPESVKLSYTFQSAKYGNQVKFNWYQGPKYQAPRPAQLEEGRELGNAGGGTLIVGDKATVMMNSHATSPRFIPESKQLEMANLIEKKNDDKAVQPIYNGHFDNWINACKGLEKPNADFAYGGRLTETMLFGNIAITTNRSLIIDPVSRKIVGDPQATALMSNPTPRKGWKI